MRAKLAVLSVGYEVEAGVYDRLLFELQGRLRQIAQDASGETARRWLAGQAPSRVGRLATSDETRKHYARLSKMVHADAGVFAQMLEAETSTIFVGPRRTLLTRGSLLSQALVGYEVVGTLSRESGIVPPGVDEFAARLVSVGDGLKRDLEQLERE